MEKTLDLKVVFFLLKKKIIWIVLAALVGGLSAFLFTENMIPKRYRSTAQVFISNTQDIGKINISDLNASKSLADTYRIILKSEKSMSLLREMLKDDEEYNSRPYKTSYAVAISVTDESEVLQFSVSSRDPELSRIVCNMMLEVSKVLIADIFDDAGEAHPLGDAKASYTPVSPDVQSNVLIGIVLATVLACTAIIVVALLDNRVKDEADFAAKVNIPVLGEVPSINVEESGKEGYYYYAYTKKEDQ